VPAPAAQPTRWPDGLIASGEQSRLESFNKRAEERLAALLREKDELRREIHRVKNKLVVAASLLELQKGHTENPAVSKMLDDIQHRIHTMALVDRKQSRAQALGHVLLDEYLEALVGYLTVAQQTARKRIRVHTDLEPITLGVDTAMPCGLIVNELIGNAFEHAFSEAHGGDVWISARRRDSGPVEIEVRDNGVGLPADLDPGCGKSLGLQIVTLLTRQIEGALTLERGSGTKFTLSFSEQASRKRV
jgi:two-component sensor histidine kinase